MSPEAKPTKRIKRPPVLQERVFVQKILPGLEEKTGPPSCGDCARLMEWIQKEVRDGRYVCPVCGNP